MKHFFSCILMAGAMTCGSPFALHAQTDVTNTYLKNQGFEDDVENWEYSKMIPQDNTDFSLKEGRIHMERWAVNNAKVGDGSVSQTMELPNGTYKLTVAAHNIQQNDPAAPQTGACIFADDTQTSVGSPADYSVTFTVIEGRVTVGFRAENATGSYIACDNFRLYLIDDSREAVLKELQARVDLATALAADKMQQDAATELQAAAAAAQQLVGTPADEEIPTAAIRLRTAYESAKESAQAYADLQAAIDEALAAYNEAGKGAAELDQAIQDAQAAAANLSATPEKLAGDLADITRATLVYNVANSTDTAPTVVTDTRHAQGSTVAFGRSTIEGADYGDLLEHGFCWSTDPNPTIFDNRSTTYLDHNGYIYVMHPMTPSTVYYARAYAMTKGHAVGYGDVIKLITIPKGNITWVYDNKEADQSTYTRLTTALATAVDYWNNLTSIRGLCLHVGFDANSASAACSYGGNMGVGPNSYYQRPGTLMHEMGHAIGEGQHGMWWSEILRDEESLWLGDQANGVVQFWENDPTARVHTDDMHKSPYGVNGAWEDDGTDVLYIANGLMTQGFGVDGLPPTSGFATPGYVFEQEDDVKYYLKSESEDYGLYTSYLYEGANRLVRWKEATADVATANDSAAWYITFDPVSQHYMFRNVATGNYITYNTSGTNGFRTIAKDVPGLTEKLHLLKGRVNVTAGRGADSITTKGYWIAYPDSLTDGQGNKTNAKGDPDCLSGRINHFTAANTIQQYNDATDQRWLILTADEAMTFEKGAKTNLLDDLAEMIALIRDMAETPHNEDVDGADLTLEASLDDIWNRAQQVRAHEIYSFIKEARAAGMEFLGNVTPKDADKPFDLNFLMNDPGVNDRQGWSEKPKIDYSCCEYWQQTFDFNQTLEEMPAGTYKLTAQAFQRPGYIYNVYNDYQNDIDNVNTVLYINDESVKIQNIASEAKKRQLCEDDVAVGTPTVYLPNTMEGASIYFQRRYYGNELYVTIKKDHTDLQLGIKCDNAPSDYWTIFDNFHLYYYGSMTKNEATAIRDVTPETGDKDAEDDTAVYNLQGIKVADSLQGLPKGIYIVNRKKVILR